MLLIFVGLLVVLGRTFYLQIVKADYYKEKARIQHEYEKPIKARRGDIVDRHGELLVTSVETYTVAVDPFLLTDTMRLCHILSERTDTTAEYYYDKIKHSNPTDTHSVRYVVLAKNVNERDIKAIKALDEKGVLEVSSPKRKYIHGKVASQILGLTDVDNIGKGGLELKYNEELSGLDGTLFCQRDALGNLYLLSSVDPIEAQNGYTLKLTVDITLQKIVEFELEKGVEFLKARSGTVVAVNPETGEILAMASYPSFDPMDRKDIAYETIKNKAITDYYAPGSTFKLFTAAAALEEGIIAEEDTVDGCGGSIRFYDKTIVDSHPMFKMTFAEAIENSSNVVFASLANAIEKAEGSSRFYKYIRDFGFGAPTGIDIIGEVKGNLLKPEKFTGVTTAYIGHGYEIGVTPLQLTMGYAAVANDGLLMKPYIVKEIATSSGKLIKEIEPKLIRQVIEEENARRLRKMFVGVVERGTGTTARVEGINIAGKTGTSQQYVNHSFKTGNYNASFIGMFPAEDPKVVMLVLMDRPKTFYYGGPAAGPVFKSIVARWINSSHGLVNDNYSIDSVLSITNRHISLPLIPSVVGLKSENAESYLEEMQYSVEYDEEGIISSQEPRGNSFRRNNKKEITVQTFNPENDLDNKDAKVKNIKLIGLSKRQAVSVISSAGYKAIVKGNGSVYRQNWRINSQNQKECLIYCR